MSYFNHLECSSCKKSFPHEKVVTYCHDCNAPIIARYDLSSARTNLDRADLGPQKMRMWRWQELLPVIDPAHIHSLGEGNTPLVPLASRRDCEILRKVWIKDESLNPTASFKARGLSIAVSKADEIGCKQLVIPTAGNAGSALAAYAARAGLRAATVMPSDTPQPIIDECRAYGAEIMLVDGLISDCANIVSEMTSSGDWFSVSTFREPYRLEGKKTMGYEIAEQFGWHLPDIIIYPTGGGTGIVGMWKAFEELHFLGWLEEKKFPKMISVQSNGCAPIAKAYESGADSCEFWENAETIASGIRVPNSMADRLILKIIRESGGLALTVSDIEILDAQTELSVHHGIFSAPEGAATFAAWKNLFKRGFIQSHESVVLFITASGVKYL
jgi:threonine synthase